MSRSGVRPPPGAGMVPTVPTVHAPQSGVRHVSRLRLLVAGVVVLALGGVVVAAVALVRGPVGPGRAAEPGIGVPVRTSFGALTVTNVSTTFVPDTQGPPSQAQHSGASGSTQLQVWVRLVNQRRSGGLSYAPSQFRLVTPGGSGSSVAPDGSTLTESLLPRGASIDGQVWFDLPKAAATPTVTRALEFRDDDGERISIPLAEGSTGATTNATTGGTTRGTPGAGSSSPSAGHDSRHDTAGS